MPAPHSDAAANWALTRLALIAETPSSHVYRAHRDETPVVLKILKPYGMNELTGIAFLEWLGGDGAVRILDREDNAILMEWLDGPELSATVHAGDDAAATRFLGGVAKRLHTPRPNPPAGLASLADWCAPLSDTPLTRWPKPHRPDIEKAKALGASLLATSPTPVPLHGDLHHDNILRGPRGWCVIDAKGILGDPAYDLANAFQNPIGALDTARAPATIERRARTFAEILGYDRQRLLDWAAAHCALSMAWNLATARPIDANLAILPNLLAAAGRT
ncbi:aminoglycoside phosphotransferase family protein [Pelagibacterium xiamenense]|uniref:aminoglycoside phosphotransferase family protein n=1 Tax=Pelagibacterium xiamenense TaxID=2901140 RepID=UPI001E338713|nr:aminoglycoside phosphotransferase family protein [Pelagibacterium xiamenense]MCD7060265.1 phosphotransferase [Pelagibacterium xiamenense]